MQKGLWKCHEPRVTTNQEVPTIVKKLTYVQKHINYVLLETIISKKKEAR